MIGTGFPPGPGTLPGALDARGREVKVLSRSVIPKEKLLASGADLYIDTFADMRMSGMGDAPTDEEFRAHAASSTSTSSPPPARRGASTR